MARTGTFPSIPRIEVRFTLGMVLITLAVINIGGWALYLEAKEYMEGMSRKRLVAIAQSVATQVDRERILSFQAGDEEGGAYRLEREKLLRLRDEAALDHVYLFAPFLGNLIDTRPDITIGESRPLTDMGTDEMAPLWEGSGRRWSMVSGGFASSGRGWR